MAVAFALEVLFYTEATEATENTVKFGQLITKAAEEGHGLTELTGNSARFGMVTARVTKLTENSTRFGIVTTRITEAAEVMEYSTKVTEAAGDSHRASSATEEGNGAHGKFKIGSGLPSRSRNPREIQPGSGWSPLGSRKRRPSSEWSSRRLLTKATELELTKNFGSKG